MKVFLVFFKKKIFNDALTVCGQACCSTNTELWEAACCHRASRRAETTRKHHRIMAQYNHFQKLDNQAVNSWRRFDQKWRNCSNSAWLLVWCIPRFRLVLIRANRTEWKSYQSVVIHQVSGSDSLTQIWSWSSSSVTFTRCAMGLKLCDCLATSPGYTPPLPQPSSGSRRWTP